MARHLVEDSVNSTDWMQEIARDAQNLTELLKRIDTITALTLDDIRRGDKVNAALHLSDVREGIRLICQLAGVKLAS